MVIEGQVRVLSSRKFCLVCSPFGRHNTKPTLTEVPSGTRAVRSYKTSKKIQCKDCGRSKKGVGSRCWPCQAKRRRYRMKRKAVDLLGGECTRCGWKEHLAGLQFHHPDPTQKDFNVSRLLVLAWARVEPELRKCVLLCANCHAIEHANAPPGL